MVMDRAERTGGDESLQSLSGSRRGVLRTDAGLVRRGRLTPDTRGSFLQVKYRTLDLPECAPQDVIDKIYYALHNSE